jgi:phosphoglycerate dehydrogenase-like enzyme
MASLFTLLLPNSIRSDLPLPDGIKAITYDVNSPLPNEMTNANGIVVWGTSWSWLKHTATRMSKVTWVQALGAGAEPVITAGFRPEATIANGSGLHDQPVAEHTMALILAAARRLNQHYAYQQRAQWSPLGGVQTEDKVGFYTLRDRQLLILGFGGIGKAIARMAAPFGAHITAVARNRRRESDVEVYPIADLASLLPAVDVLVIALPGGADTYHLLDGKMLALLPRHAWIVNIGRGSVVAENELISCLSEGRLAGAALDVFETEPLPPSSPLWSLPTVIITSHAAGGRPVGYAALIAANARAAIGKGQWQNVVRPGICESNRNTVRVSVRES